MELTLFKFSANIQSDIFLKDPESSPLGTTIFTEGIDLIDGLGFEDFTFRKLAKQIGTTEASIYRYFENKHKFLLYITSWYWCWVDYQMVIRNANINAPITKLKNSIDIISAASGNQAVSVDLQKIFNVICNDSSKGYFSKKVDILNQHGVYFNYKKIVSNISDIILEINPSYDYSHMLVTTIIEGIHHQIFFAKHLPGLTDVTTKTNYITHFYCDMAMSL
ncbi:MAG: TetR/AcrR family transcriptional regulator, partial [Saprospiraceae bacterium]